MNYSVSSELYEEVAARLAEAIGSESYFSGVVTGEFADVAWRLVLSVVVYRRRISIPEGDYDALANLVPVWWEFHTEAAAGEILNDFSFTELVRYLPHVA